MAKNHIEGLDKFVNSIKEASKLLSQEELKKIVRKESEVIIKTAQSKAPTTDIKNSIGFIEKNENKFTKTVLIGPRYYGGFKGQLAHTFEYGTAPRYTKDGAYRGFITARPFMRPALDAHSSNIVTNVAKKVIKLATDKLK
jgi:HK97 gp10 family phage protein